MTLKELIKVRKNKFDEQKQASCADLHKGYMCGWENAYQDLEEILTQNGFDTNIIVIKGDTER
jgi:virulence-associated protein VapD